MNKVFQLTSLIAVCALLSLSSTIAFADECKNVRGRVVANSVVTFSNGFPCPSLLCTEGRFSGGLKGTFSYFATGSVPYNQAVMPPPEFPAPPNIDASTGVITLTPKSFCKGELFLSDTSAFSFNGPRPTQPGDPVEGIVSAIETIVGGTGSCEGVTGQITLEGIFENGCVDCTYRGQVCGGPADDEDDEDDEDEDDD